MDLLLILVVVLIIVLIWRGPQMLPQLGEALGRAVKGVRDNVNEGFGKSDDDARSDPDAKAGPDAKAEAGPRAEADAKAKPDTGEDDAGTDPGA